MRDREESEKVEAGYGVSDHDCHCVCDGCGNSKNPDACLEFYPKQKPGSTEDRPAPVTLCEDCQEEATRVLDLKNGRPDFEMFTNDELEPAMWKRVLDWAQKNRVLCFIPADEQINDLRDVGDFFEALTAMLGLNWCPDTPFEKYTWPDNSVCFQAEDGPRDLNACMEKCWKVVKAEQDRPRPNIYELAMKATAHLMPTPAPDLLTAAKAALEQLERCLAGADLNASADEAEAGVIEYQQLHAAIAGAERRAK